MGIYLSSPKTEKFSEDGENARVKYGLSSMQGWRAAMEDALRRYRWKNKSQGVWKIVPSCIWWTIWKKRNARYFEGKSSSIQKIKRSSISLLLFGVKNN